MRTKIGDWVYICRSKDGYFFNAPTFPWYMWKVTSITRDKKYIHVRRRAAPGTWGCCGIAWSWVRCEDAPELKSLLNPARKTGHYFLQNRNAVLIGKTT